MYLIVGSQRAAMAAISSVEIVANVSSLFLSPASVALEKIPKTIADAMNQLTSLIRVIMILHLHTIRPLRLLEGTARHEPRFGVAFR